MVFIKRYSFVILTMLLAAAVIFLPGFFMKQADQKEFGNISVEAVSPARNALLANLSFEERIELYCDAYINPLLLFGWTESDDNVSIAMKDKAQDMVEYSYEIEDQRVFEKYMDEFQRLIELNVLPEYIDVNKKTIDVKGQRIYLYSEKEDRGAVYVWGEWKGLLESGKEIGGRFVAEEESGKIIALHLNSKMIEKEDFQGVNWGKNYLAYLDLDGELYGKSKMEQVYKIGSGSCYYCVFYGEDELGMYPMK